VVLAGVAQAVGGDVTEAELQREVERLLDEAGLLWHHCPRAYRCRGPAGFPDLLALGLGGLLVAELKGPDGETSAAQDLWHWTAARAGLRPRLWRPADLNGRIATELDAIK